MEIRRGYWRASVLSKTTYACQMRNGARWTPCLGSRNASQGRRRLSGNEQGMLCADGYGGPKCEVCVADQYYFAERDAKCHECGEVWRTLGWAVTGIAAAATLSGAIFGMALHRGWLTRTSTGTAIRRARLAWMQV